MAAAAIIHDRVRSSTWRIFVGQDAKTLDTAVRGQPEAAYDYAELTKQRLTRPRPSNRSRTIDQPALPRR
ncbi:MAG: hypothetical protein JO372_02210 [Solirubrobacterales bacterium]|nr:hypothetical protein [Solirubrobacterales bacterium]